MANERLVIDYKDFGGDRHQDTAALLGLVGV
jgi:hypothetical protein